MAKQEKGAAAPAAEKKTSKGAHKFTMEELMKTNKGKLLLWLRKAYAIGKINKFKGTSGEGLAFPAGGFYGATRPNGSYWKLDEAGPAYKALAEAVRKSFDDLEKGVWSKNVQAITELPLGSGNAGGARTVNIVLPASARQF